MRATIYRSELATAELTGESSQSSYGIPVLRIVTRKTGEATDYGPHAALPFGVFALDFVTSFHDGADLSASGWGGRWIKSKAGAALAERFKRLIPLGRAGEILKALYDAQDKNDLAPLDPDEARAIHYAVWAREMHLDPASILGADISVEVSLGSAGQRKANKLASLDSADDLLFALKSVPWAINSFRVRQFLFLFVGLAENPAMGKAVKKFFRTLVKRNMSRRLSDHQRRRLHQAMTAFATVSFLRHEEEYSETGAVKETVRLASEAAQVTSKREAGDSPALLEQAKKLAQRAGCRKEHLSDLAELAGKTPASVRALVTEAKRSLGRRTQARHTRAPRKAASRN